MIILTHPQDGAREAEPGAGLRSKLTASAPIVSGLRRDFLSTRLLARFRRLADLLEVAKARRHLADTLWSTLLGTNLAHQELRTDPKD